MGATFWIKRYLLAAVPLFAILAAVEWFKGSTSQNDYLIAAAWALGAAALFTWSAWRRQREAEVRAMAAGAPAQAPGKSAKRR